MTKLGTSTRWRSLLTRTGRTERVIGANERVAVVGLLAAIVTLAFALWLRSEMRVVREVRVPAANAAAHLRASIERSISLLVVGVALDDDDARQLRREIWRDEIIPTFERVQGVTAGVDRPEVEAAVAQAGDRLRRLQQVQWEVEMLGASGGDVPAQVVYTERFAPLYASAVAALRPVWPEGAEPLPPPLLSAVAELRLSYAEFDGTLLRLLDDASPGAIFAVEGMFKRLDAELMKVTALSTDLPAKYSPEGIALFLSELRASLVQARLAVTMRTQRDWSLGRIKAEEELGPLVAEIRAQAEEGARQQSENARASLRGIARFGALVVILSLIMGLSSLASLYTSLRASHRMREVLQRAKMLGQYAIETRLGGGAMGDVYRAQHALLRRPTAIKVIKGESAFDDDAKERFQQEVQLTSQLTHPNTVQVFDYGRTPDGFFYYAMELLVGLDLQTLVDRFGPVEPARVADILRQACGSLAEAHHRGLLHRDLKPSNIMVTERGQDRDVVKVLDFGLAKKVADDDDDERVGTPAYMAPESIARADYGPRTDLYALGGVGYFLLTGQPPYPADSLGALVKAHASGLPPRPAQIRGRTLPEGLEAVLMSCLDPDPTRRPTSALELADLLAEVGLEWSESDRRVWWSEHAEVIASMGPIEVRRGVDGTLGSRQMDIGIQRSLG